ncbi:hypothetical protein L596_008916 [Steinernema carpocapsae]|uniref:Uncharacterized protein n=1 Tax=Steinernema carpocapsae TaxID=34508 RepID=A0A4V6A6F2_STECR|nr:hypothetical protein L596_008916 [Steinernema carpocapsae]
MDKIKFQIERNRKYSCDKPTRTTIILYMIENLEILAFRLQVPCQFSLFNYLHHSKWRQERQICLSHAEHQPPSGFHVQPGMCECGPVIDNVVYLYSL